MSKRNEIIRKLRLEIFDVQRLSQEHNQQVLNEATKEQTAELKNSDGKKTKLREEIVELKKKFDTNMNDHRESELALRKVRVALLTETFPLNNYRVFSIKRRAPNERQVQIDAGSR